MGFKKYYEENYQGYIDKTVDDVLEKIKKEIDFDIETRIYIAGNGGSGYTASHFAQDLVKVCDIKAISLSENIGLILAVANDIGFEDIFKYQLEKTEHYGIFIGISFSGNSENILRAVEYANLTGMTTISLTGGITGGKLALMTDYNINIGNDNIFVVESFHSMICHYFVDMLKEKNEQI
jgi:D-sedoheptulose 7-phosphate isomerase